MKNQRNINQSEKYLNTLDVWVSAHFVNKWILFFVSYSSDIKIFYFSTCSYMSNKVSKSK